MTAIGADTRKEQIYRAASTLFSERGFQATSVRDIARVLDLQGGSLYAHIASKEDVLWEIVSRAADAFYQSVAPIVGGDQPVPERLRRMIRAHVHVVVSQLSHATVFFQDWRHLSEPRRGEVLRLRDGYEALFRGVIAEGVAAGELRDVEPKMATLMMLSTLNGIPGWYRPDGDLAADEVAEEFAELLLAGLAQRTSTRGERSER